MKKLSAILLFLAGMPSLVLSQELISEYELDWVYKYSSYELEDVDPDSVFGFYEYGSVYSPEDFTDEDEQLTTAVLDCRNLQVLELHNIMATDVLSQLERFPKLQYLILDNVGMPNVPDGIYTLEHLKKLSLSYFTEFYMDPTRIKGEDVKDLELSYIELNCSSDDENCELPLAAFPHITKLTIKGEMTSLPESLYGCTDLIELDASECELEEIGDKIGDLEYLETLNLSQNYYLTELPDEFGNLANLRYLDLSSTGFYTLPPALEYLSGIESLDVSYSSMEEVPDFIGSMSSLYSLTLNGCSSLSNLPSALKNCPSLSYLALYGCGFTTFPGVIGQMPNLIEVDLSYNYITAVPRSLSNSKSLLVLDLSGNNIETFEPECFNVPSIYKLKMGSCGLNTIPAELFKLSGLEYLDLSYDSITEIPSGFYALTKLSTIYLEYNQIKTMPKGISKLPLLTDLNVSANQLTSLPKDLSACTNLGYLYLYDNKLKKFPKKMGNLQNLMYLDVRGNKDIAFKKDFATLTGIYEIKLRPGDISDEALAKLRAMVGDDKVYISEY